MEAYLDNSATTRVLDSVKDLMVTIMTEDYGNPSSMHRKGMEAERYVREARENIARTLKVQDKEIIFTSGGTESNNMALIGILAAMVFVLTKFVSIPIPSPMGKTAISCGNAMSILGALLFGPWVGALAAGIGNALVDLTDPAWAPEFWITFINKFLMAFIAGVIMHKVHLGSERVRVWVASLCGALTYCVLYVAKNILEGALVRGFTWEVAIMETLTVKLPVTLVNAVIAVVCAALLYLALRQPLRKAHVLSA